MKQPKTILEALKMGTIPALTYKGFTVIFINGEYRASAYSNPDFNSKSYSGLKKQINTYLK